MILFVVCSARTPCCSYDFEATTNKTRTLHPIEIMELSCAIVNTATASITASYQSFVRPTEHPILDPFAVELCGIQQSQVDAAPLLADVMQHHHEWLQEQGVLADGVSCVPVTWTEWDLKVKAVSALLVWRLRVT
jgi:inhibitor of KinA sporulation pathway (predicted exonuclease)